MWWVCWHGQEQCKCDWHKKKTTNTSKQTIIFGVWQSRGCHTIVWMTPLGDSIKRYIRQSEPHTCAAGLVLGAVPMQQQCEDQDQNKDESHQSHDQQKPPLLIERTLRQRCTQGEEQTGGRGKEEHTHHEGDITFSVSLVHTETMVRLTWPENIHKSVYLLRGEVE